ncbi:MAG: hypothetical protein ACLUD0_02820 [Eubacterium ramulus]
MNRQQIDAQAMSQQLINSIADNTSDFRWSDRLQNLPRVVLNRVPLQVQRAELLPAKSAIASQIEQGWPGIRCTDIKRRCPEAV